MRIEDYALIGDTHTAALVGRTGSIDWFCAPRFDDAAAFCALLGDESNGAWSLCPDDPDATTSRRYLEDTLVLETTHTTSTGRATVTDFMPVRGLAGNGGGDGGGGGGEGGPIIVRIVEGITGSVTMTGSCRVRFDYGAIVPWVRRVDHTGFTAVGGADALILFADVPMTGRDLRHDVTFDVDAGERVVFTLEWFPSHRPAPARPDATALLDETVRWWSAWTSRCADAGPWSALVRRSLITLKALSFAPTGGIIAAPTTSLPEAIGGARNWDYRYCWLRDATYTLVALIDAGYEEEATAWSDWLRRTVAGSPDKMQIVYGVGGERRLTETELDWLPGYEGSAPVRVGNAASGQFQLDVYGEVMDMFLLAARHELPHDGGRPGRGLPGDAVEIGRFLVDHVRRVWRDPDNGIWEVRGPLRHFVHSKVMAWVAVDRWLGLIDLLGLPDDPAPWRAVRAEIHDDVCRHGWNAEVGSFTQYYGGTGLDAGLLLLGLVGFLPEDDPRLAATVDAVQAELLVDGLVQRYRTDPPADGDGDQPGDRSDNDRAATVDGLAPGEGTFLLATFWLVDALVHLGRIDEARTVFERLAGLANDVGLLAEEYDPVAGRMLGNFPQAFSHVGLVNAALDLAEASAGGGDRVRQRAGPTTAPPD